MLRQRQYSPVGKEEKRGRYSMHPWSPKAQAMVYTIIVYKKVLAGLVQREA